MTTTRPARTGQGETNRKEVIFMLQHLYVARSIHEQRIRPLRDAARNERIARRVPRRRVRRAIGRSMVRVGRRLAAEPLRQPARSP